MFSFWLAQNANSNGQDGMKVDGGMITLGGYDEDYFEGEIFWVPISKAWYWQVEVDAVTIDGKSLSKNRSANPNPSLSLALALALALALTRFSHTKHTRIAQMLLDVLAASVEKPSPVLYGRPAVTRPDRC